MLPKFIDVLKRYSIFMILYIFSYIAILTIKDFQWLYIALGVLIFVSLFSFSIFKYHKNDSLADYSYDFAIMFILLLGFLFFIKTSAENYELIFMGTFFALSFLALVFSLFLKKLSDHTLVTCYTVAISLFTLAIFQAVEILTTTIESLSLYILITLITTTTISLFVSTSLFNKHYRKHYQVCPLLNRDLSAKLALQNQKEVSYANN